MRNVIRSIGLAVIAALSLAACGGGGGGGSAAPPPPPDWQGTLISNPSVSPVTSFMQSVPTDTTGTVYFEIFPTQANAWTLDLDFTLVDGHGNQFFYAPAVAVGSTSFPLDQSYSELKFYTPYLGTADGVKTAVVSDGVSFDLATLESTWINPVKVGTYAAFLNATSDSRLQQTLDLTSLPTNSTVTLSWQDAVSLDPGAFLDYPTRYRVVVYDQNGTLLQNVFETQFGTLSGETQIHNSISLAYGGRTIILSFEERSSTSPFSQAYAIIDEVSVKDNSNQEHVTNGGFESGMTGWTANTPQEVQNVTSGSRSLEGLDVTRSFYTAPNKLWGRWVDVFTNNTGSPISKTVTYETSLGSGGAGVIYTSTSGTAGPSSVASWDAATGSRDIGWVFGTKLVSSATFTSADGTGAGGSDLIDVAFNITVPAGGSVALVNFIIMDGTSTAAVAGGNAATRATAIDAVAADIVSNFRNNPQLYQRGMTQQQIDAIKNF